MVPISQEYCDVATIAVAVVPMQLLCTRVRVLLYCDKSTWYDKKEHMVRCGRYLSIVCVCFTEESVAGYTQTKVEHPGFKQFNHLYK